MVTKKSNSRMFSVLFMIAMLVGVVAFPYSARAAGILYVTPSGAGNCASWAAACGLQTALTTSVSGDEIWVAAGTYKPTTNTDRTVSFVLKNGVAVYGGFAGTETLRTQRNPAANVTILSGDIDNNDSQTPIITNLTTVTDNTTNSYNVVTGSGTNNTAILDGFTITGGNANALPSERGGGMYNNSGSPALANVIFIGNNASQQGGGMYNLTSNPLLINVTFNGNSAYEGGGLYNYNSNPSLTNLTFNSNKAGNSGGGMYSDGSSPLLLNSTFSTNTAGISGGAMLNNLGSSPTLTNVTLSENSAPHGGGIHNRYASNPTLTHVTFSTNIASLYGGGMYNYQSSPILTDVAFSNNTATSIFGGGMYNEYGSSPNLTNVTFTGNSAYRGGGIYNHQDSNPQLMNVTFNGNNALNEGGGIFNSSSILMITNSLFDQNHAVTDGGAIYNAIGDVTILNSTFSRNGALNEGGSIFNSTTFIGKMTVTNSTFFGNDASNNGGGILNLGPMTITNSTLSENTAGINGGGLNNADGTVTILNSTFSGNSAITAGGGIRNDGTMSYTNTIVANSTSGGDCSNFWTISTNTNNLVEDGSCSAMLNGDPKLGLLANNGGVTQTMALLSGSPAIDAGNDPICSAAVGAPEYGAGGLDQRGIVRPQGAHCDIGAYEFVDTTVPTINSITRINLNPTNLASVQFTVTFSESVAGVNTVFPFNDFTLTTSGVTGASITSVTPVSGTTYTVTVNTGSGNGTIRLDVVDDNSIVDTTSNPLGGAAVGDGNFIGGQVYNIDKTPPAVLSSMRVNLNPTNLPSVGFTVTFSEPVTGVDAATPFNDFTLTTIGISGASIASVSGSGTTYLVTVNTGTPTNSISTLININIATLEELDSLPGIGPTTSQKIIEYRTLNGPFWVIEDIMNVSGIGPSTFEDIKNLITVGGSFLRLDVVDNNSIVDAASNPLGGVAVGDGNFATGEVYTINKPGGGSTTGVFRPSNGLLYLKNANTTGFADVAINYGTGGDYPIAGDWDGNGTATIGIYRNGSFYLRNSNTLGFADIVFAFGTPGDQPVAGDWDGDGVDTIGVYSNGQFLLRNSNSAGTADMSFFLGNPGDVGIAGDWNGDGMDTTGVFRPSNGIIFLKNANTTGFADIALNYGLAGDMPVTGDWNNDGIDTIGVYRNAQFLLRNSNTIGFAEIVFGLGNPGDMPISGNWDGIP